jgi:hypothetical protein
MTIHAVRAGTACHAEYRYGAKSPFYETKVNCSQAHIEMSVGRTPRVLPDDPRGFHHTLHPGGLVADTTLLELTLKMQTHMYFIHSRLLLATLTTSVLTSNAHFRH